MSEIKPIYLNPKLKRLLACEKQGACVIGGRGVGKSTYVGAEIYDCSQRMPGMLGGIWGLTFVQILTKILPSAKKQLMAMGLKHDRPGSPGHFVIGRKPPRHYKMPYNEPLRWDNVLTLFNGSAWEFISVDRPDTVAGTSQDVQIYDEAVYFPKDLHDIKGTPSLRGNNQYFGHCPKHGIQRYVSSQAWDATGYWVEDQKYELDKNGDILLDENDQPVLNPDFEFIHATSWDNVAILTEKTLRKWERTLPKTVYDIEIMAKRMTKVSNAFYEKYDGKTHTYIKSYEYGFDYKQNEFGVYVKHGDKDRNPKGIICLSLDFGINFNSMLVSQYHKSKHEQRFINEFFESSNQLLTNLIDPFIHTYQNHANKRIELYGDPAGNKVEHMERFNLFEKITKRLQQAGWIVYNRMNGRAYPLHKTKHQFINEVLQEDNHKLPIIRINKHKCKYLQISIERAQMDEKGRKKKAEERNTRLSSEITTHLSDAFDYQIFYKFFGALIHTENAGGIRFGGIQN